MGRFWLTLAHPPTLVEHVESAVESHINSVSNLSVLSISTHTPYVLGKLHVQEHFVTQYRHTHVQLYYDERRVNGEMKVWVQGIVCLFVSLPVKEAGRERIHCTLNQ